jgi:hypothetical protein
MWKASAVSVNASRLGKLNERIWLRPLKRTDRPQWNEQQQGSLLAWVQLNLLLLNQ